MDKTVEQEVRRRAQDRCEYCRRPQRAFELKFQIDHILARQHVRDETIDNLALACGFCNRHKGPNISGLDPKTGKLTRLFHPRLDRWEDHFTFQNAQLLGRTDVGRATVVLAMNHSDQVDVRRELINEGLM